MDARDLKDRIEGKKAIIYVTDEDIHKNTKNFKSHRDYIAHRFKQLGIEVIRWHTTDGGRKPGLKYMAGDSQLLTFQEITGIIGENVKFIDEDHSIIVKT